MRPSVAAGFASFSHDLEGRLGFLYLDGKGLVTTAIGLLIDDSPRKAPWRPALALPWRREDGTPATHPEIIQQWETVKRRANPAAGGGTHGKWTTIRLTGEDIDAITAAKLRSVDVQLARLFADWETWPADAQLALCSWAWAVGAGAEYPRMIAALRRRDFAEAAEEIAVTDGKGGEPGTLAIRNTRNVLLLRNAANIEAAGLAPEPLYWPSLVMPPDLVA